MAVSRRESLLNKDDEIMPMRAYFLGHIGWSPASKYSTPKGLMVKDFRLWTEQRSVKDIEMNRMMSVDPRAPVNKYLV